MLNSSPETAAAMTAGRRRILPRAVNDLIDPDITYAKTATNGHDAYSQLAQIHNRVTENAAKYATLEPDRWTLDGTWDVYPANPAETKGEVGYIGGVMSGAGGAFTQPYPWVRLNVDNCRVLQACVIVFTDVPEDGYGTDFTVDIFSGDKIYHTEAIAGNAGTRRVVEGFTVYDVTAIRVTFTRWSLPGRYPRVIEIIPGLYETWDGDIIYYIDIMEEADISCLRVPYDTAILEIIDEKRRFDPQNEKGLFKSLEERQETPLFFAAETLGAELEYMPRGVFYRQSWENGDDGRSMKFKLVSIIGLLASRKFNPPDVLPETLEGWIQELLSQIGVNFKNRYILDAGVSNTPLICSKTDVENVTCADILRYACMAAGVYPRADTETGFLRVELPPGYGGVPLTLDNMIEYPVIKANDSIAALTFRLGGSADARYTAGGTNTAAGRIVGINNFFIKTQEEAQKAARNILKNYGVQLYDLASFGDLRSELGDIDTVELGRGGVLAGRRIKQQYRLDGGIMENVISRLMKIEAENLFSHTVILTKDGSWTAPDNVTRLKIVLIGGGAGGMSGEAGSYFGSYGTPGAGGQGGRIYVAEIDINPGQTVHIVIGAGGAAGQSGVDTRFGNFTSRDGLVFDGWTDIATGNTYGRAGASGGRSSDENPLPGTSGAPNTGDGGAGGSGGAPAVLSNGSTGTVIKHPTPGGAGGQGGSGCVIISYDI